jgi:hypothetical protein
MLAGTEDIELKQQNVNFVIGARNTHLIELPI